VLGQRAGGLRRRDAEDISGGLTQMNLLQMDRTIGLAAHRAGLVMMAGAILWACWMALRVCHARSSQQPDLNDGV
jgi:hypothetical protein